MWQDSIFTVGSIIFIGTLVPALLKPNTRFPRWSSFLTAGTLAVYGATFFTLLLPLSGLMALLTALTWTAIGIFRPLED